MIDLLGWDAEKATALLAERGLSWVTEIAKPPGKQWDNGYLKVIKQEFAEGMYRLTLCIVPDDFR